MAMVPFLMENENNVHYKKIPGRIQEIPRTHREPLPGGWARHSAVIRPPKRRTENIIGLTPQNKKAGGKKFRRRLDRPWTNSRGWQKEKSQTILWVRSYSSTK
jgi:hypothetical protein